jgi:hypothetical protein
MEEDDGMVEAGGALMGEDAEAELAALMSTIEKTWAVAYDAKVRPSASDNIMKQR